MMTTLAKHHDNQQDNRQHAAADHHHEAAVPAEEIDGVADDGARGYGTAEIAKQTGEARSGTGGFFRKPMMIIQAISTPGLPGGLSQ